MNLIWIWISIDRFSFQFLIFGLVFVSYIAWTRSKTIDAIEVPILAVKTSIILFATFGISAVRTVWHVVLATDAIVSIRATERWKLKCMSKDRILRPRTLKTTHLPPSPTPRLFVSPALRWPWTVLQLFLVPQTSTPSVNSNKKANNLINNIVFSLLFFGKLKSNCKWKYIFTAQRQNERREVALLNFEIRNCASRYFFPCIIYSLSNSLFELFHGLYFDLPHLLCPLCRGIERVQCVFFWDRTESNWDGLHIRVDICSGADAQYVDFV